MAGGHYCFPVATTGCPANDCDWKDHSTGFLTDQHSDPGNEPYDHLMKHDWNLPTMRHWVPVIADEGIFLVLGPSTGSGSTCLETMNLRRMALVMQYECFNYPHPL